MNIYDELLDAVSCKTPQLINYVLDHITECGGVVSEDYHVTVLINMCNNENTDVVLFDKILALLQPNNYTFNMVLQHTRGHYPDYNNIIKIMNTATLDDKTITTLSCRPIQQVMCLLKHPSFAACDNDVKCNVLVNLLLNRKFTCAKHLISRFTITLSKTLCESYIRSEYRRKNMYQEDMRVIFTTLFAVGVDPYDTIMYFLEHMRKLVRTKHLEWLLTHPKFVVPDGKHDENTVRLYGLTKKFKSKGYNLPTRVLIRYIGTPGKITEIVKNIKYYEDKLVRKHNKCKECRTYVISSKCEYRRYQLYILVAKYVRDLQARLLLLHNHKNVCKDLCMTICFTITGVRFKDVFFV